jgi:hypothetical protein
MRVAAVPLRWLLPWLRAVNILHIAATPSFIMYTRKAPKDTAPNSSSALGILATAISGHS